MLKHSSGILVYRYSQGEIQVLLCHMGGPYWKDVEFGSWSIPKGESRNEKSIDTALREFQEETSFQVKKDNLQFLGSKKQANHKLVTIFITQDILALPALCRRDGIRIRFSGTPRTDGKTQRRKCRGILKEFPEMDRAEWMNLNDAKKKILNGQVYFINKLERTLKND